MGLGLEHLHCYPELLIPQALRQAFPGAQIEAAPITVWYGRLDEFDTPVLSAVIIQKDAYLAPVKEQEDDLEHWDETLNGRRRKAINQHQMTATDKLLLTISADDKMDPGKGVEVKDYAQIRELRRSPHRIGTAFYHNFESLLTKMGYDYIWGQNSNVQSRQQRGGNIGFFRSLGRVPLGELVKVPKGIPNSALKEDPSQVTTIKFLNPDVQCKFLGESSLELATAQGV